METRAVICVERIVNGEVKWLPLASTSGHTVNGSDAFLC
jgi:hypothetical protein